MGLSIDKINRQIDNYYNNADNINNNNFKDRFIPLDDNNFISPEEIASIYLTMESYKPEIFLTEPQKFMYNGNKAVKIEIFYHEKRKRKAIIKIIHTIIHAYSIADPYSPNIWEYEILSK
ncbi:MAG: hypothetical protein JXB49_37300 [Bacteroidales bacterium]|nr:hypothetical protein [Bacteroidales bacterium]